MRVDGCTLLLLLLLMMMMMMLLLLLRLRRGNVRKCTWSRCWSHWHELVPIVPPLGSERCGTGGHGMLVLLLMMMMVR